MTAVDDWRARLAALDRGSWPAFLDAHSGLPGPRANLSLAAAYAGMAGSDEAESLSADPDEYRASCGAQALGRWATEPDVTARLAQLAADGRWRVREGVAMALQRLGDSDPDELVGLALTWADDEDPLVQRAAAAGICEPRLLKAPDRAASAIEVCRRITTHLVDRPAAQRRDAGVRTLRQTLGYCWSVAVAADPAPGLVAFGALEKSDPDVAWIVAENRRKARFARISPS